MSKALCLYAFDTLYSELKHSKPLALASIVSEVHEAPDSFPNKAPLFVTWDKDDNLRGCIGTFAAQPIERGVKRFALTAALEDPRFPSISLAELPHLSCDVTLLDNFTPISDALSWKVGTHGLKLSFEYDGRYYSGTFLPSVAEEQQWDQLTTLWYLLRKADYNSVSKSNTLKFYSEGLSQGWMELETYEGLKHTLGYDEYKKFKS
ncbi:hypothetical protein PSN45_002115 [Yamadazyma tenuis]|uniref:AMMECR1 domain-containing protein n=1 Tax=Candida tenuis (strain ATCC 10573 / BCRC 21748 / CBS 615 / JCM 9827 / NBRC 10315 / NRRL Y-1498 / VKM Y-70) TaxID=590646 RepID=G3BC80_CANTC|nr:uncharacterized protein CANTEDRAFT_99658 [Yamadazyma tenuis ATCC 10573]EGV60138.1 hypothetical protein CANTEDRAFT_99658 [Yamadazyma tenuis ATCC 10573]WEJ94624.1 hypothetical protein PSN45_002115 [Yamadazyma tenuis]